MTFRLWTDEILSWLLDLIEYHVTIVTAFLFRLIYPLFTAHYAYWVPTVTHTGLQFRFLLLRKQILWLSLLGQSFINVLI